MPGQRAVHAGASGHLAITLAPNYPRLYERTSQYTIHIPITLSSSIDTIFMHTSSSSCCTQLGKDALSLLSEMARAPNYLHRLQKPAEKKKFVGSTERFLPSTRLTFKI
jgi:hypothetical protein